MSRAGSTTERATNATRTMRTGTKRAGTMAAKKTARASASANCVVLALYRLTRTFADVDPGSESTCEEVIGHRPENDWMHNETGGSQLRNPRNLLREHDCEGRETAVPLQAMV